MKTNNIRFASILLILLVSVNAFAKEKVKVGRTLDEAVSEKAPTRWGAGFSTFGSGNLGSGLLAAPSLSVQIELNPKAALQVFAGILSTNPFQFGVGGVFRANVAGDSNLGFHAGGGFNLGTKATSVVSVNGDSSTSFFLNLFPVAGFHFGFGGPASNTIQFSLDGGPIFMVTPSPFEFSLAPLSFLSGLSVHYFF